MKRSILIILMFCLLSSLSCKTQETKELKGYIYIKLVDIGNLYGTNKEYIESLKKEVDQYKKGSIKDDEKKTIYEYFDILFKNNLENTPSIFVQLKEQNSPVRFFISENEYHDVQKLIKNLDKNNERIEMIVDAKKIVEGVFLVKQVKSIQKLSGKTNWSK